MRTLTVASDELISNPLSFSSAEYASCGSDERRSSVTLLASAWIASWVGKVLRMTTMSATSWPAIIVPFLCDPTWRTSSTCYQQHTIQINTAQQKNIIMNHTRKKQESCAKTTKQCNVTCDLSNKKLRHTSTSGLKYDVNNVSSTSDLL